MQVATLDRVCKHCGNNFVMTRADRPRAGCCSRECHQAWKRANGLRKQPPPKKNDPTEAGVIYGLCDPVTHQVRYIGKTVNLKSRMRRYRSGCHHSPHLKNWIASLGRKGQWPEVKVLETCLFGLGDAEKHWIKHGRDQGWDLMNATDGGDGGFTLTLEAKERNRQAQLKRYQNPSARRSSKMCSQKAAATQAGKTHQQWRDDRAAQLRQERSPEYRMLVDQQRRDRAIFQRAEALKRQADARAKEAKDKEDRKRNFGVIVPLTCKGSAFVPLTQGEYAVIDAEDWERVSRYRWAAQSKGCAYRAKRSISGGGIELLGRFIINTLPHEQARFRSRNQLDCRKCNIHKSLGSPDDLGRISESREQPDTHVSSVRP